MYECTTLFQYHCLHSILLPELWPTKHWLEVETDQLHSSALSLETTDDHASQPRSTHSSLPLLDLEWNQLNNLYLIHDSSSNAYAGQELKMSPVKSVLGSEKAHFPRKCIDERRIATLTGHKRKIPKSTGNAKTGVNRLPPSLSPFAPESQRTLYTFLLASVEKCLV